MPGHTVSIHARAVLGLWVLGCAPRDPIGPIASSRGDERPAEAVLDPARSRSDLQSVATLESELEVTYLANEGVLVDDGRARVLIDGLHRFYRKDYPVLPDDDARRVEQAKPPFADIDLLLVSHHHGDHFDAEAVASYLVHAPEAVLASSAQVTDAVRGVAQSPDVVARIQTISWSPSAREERRFGTIEVTFLGLSHGERPGPPIENFGHLVRMAGRTVLHLGDAEPDPRTFVLSDDSPMTVDVALVPYWYMTDENAYRLLLEQVEADRWVAFHVGTREPEVTAKKVWARNPDAVVMTGMLRSYRF